MDSNGPRTWTAPLGIKLASVWCRLFWLANCCKQRRKGLQKRDYERKVLSQDYLFLVSGRFPQRLGRGEVCSMPNHSLWSQRHFTAMSVAIAIYCHSYKDSCKSRRWQFSAHQFVEVIFRRQPIHIRPHLASATSACCLWNWVSNAFTRGHVQFLHVIFRIPSTKLILWQFIRCFASTMRFHRGLSSSQDTPDTTPMSRPSPGQAQRGAFCASSVCHCFSRSQDTAWGVWMRNMRMIITVLVCSRFLASFNPCVSMLLVDTGPLLPQTFEDWLDS